MEIQLICVGKLKETWWRDACGEYAKRLQHSCSFSIREVPETRLSDRPSPAQIEAALEEEGRKILAAAGNAKLFALCIEGDEMPSEMLADTIEQIGLHGVSRICFAIGSSYGLCDTVKSRADRRLSMSPMTFPHQLARVMLCEQIYRAFQIMGHGKYHK